MNKHEIQRSKLVSTFLTLKKYFDVYIKQDRPKKKFTIQSNNLKISSKYFALVLHKTNTLFLYIYIEMKFKSQESIFIQINSEEFFMVCILSNSLSQT